MCIKIDIKSIYFFYKSIIAHSFTKKNTENAKKRNDDEHAR